MPHFLAARVRSLLAQLPYLVPTLSLVWHAARKWTLAWAVLLVLQGVLPVAGVYLTRALVDGLVAVVDAGGDWPALQPVLILAALIAIVLLLTESLRSLSNWVRTAQGELVQDHVHQLIHEKAIALDLAFYESPEYYDQLHRARIDALSRPVALLENFGTLLQNTITLLAMAAVLLTYGIWLPILLFAGTLPALSVVLRHTIRFHNWRIRSTTAVRRTRYYDWMLTLREAAAEIRLFDLGDHFIASFQQLRLRLRNERVALARDEALASLWAGLFGLLTMALALVWMMRQAMLGLVTLGDLALFYQAFQQGQRMMRSLLTSSGEVYRNTRFLENLFEFLALEPQLQLADDPIAPDSILRSGIQLEDISFRYPGSQRWALHDFSLAIPAGRITAIVGENGAGKSTVIKLVCRFYDPDAGRVLFDGIDIKTLAHAALLRQITVLFQEPMHYHTTAARNIAMGDLANAPPLDAIERAARAAGADAPIARLPEGYDTVLGKWFGGAELSVGEWQRVALARAFLRRAELIILDEPTSAMDSWAEADWLERFRSLAANRTALIITHRFTTAMQADVIHVMMEGRIVESGSHDQLMARDGRYASSWRKQMRQGQPTIA